MTDTNGSAKPAGLLEPDQMAYRARALAQSEVFSSLARNLVMEEMATEREAQPGNFAIWASAAYTKGYCVRKVEEDDVGLAFEVTPEEGMPERSEVEATTEKIALALRSEDSDIDPYLISDPDRLFEVLDQIIGSEVRNRLDTVGSQNMSSRARSELEDYITYWVVRGYALRAAEQLTGAITPASNPS
ncbi:MAG: hypothetical protein ACLGI2_09860 [Acidimicrobiia bacterium]